MRTRDALQLLLAGICLVGVAGCTSLPISKPLREQAQGTRDVGFVGILQNPEAYTGRVVIWGGTVIETENDTNGASVYVLQAPLDSRERPQSTKLSQGRFIARSSGFIDPEVYKKGTRVTAAGVLTGTETHTVGNMRYAYPVVTISELYSWAPEPEVYMAPPPAWWGYGPYGPYYGSGFDFYYYPGRYHYPYYYYRGPRGRDHDRR